MRWVFFYDSGSLHDSACVTIKYTSYPVGVRETISSQGFLSSVFPNPADAKTCFTYSVPSGLQRMIIIRNLIGATMQTEQLSSDAGKLTISTANLNDGIYFCSLMVDGKIIQTKKLIVKH